MSKEYPGGKQSKEEYTQDTPEQMPTTLYTERGESWRRHEKRLALCILIIVIIMRCLDVIAS